MHIKVVQPNAYDFSEPVATLVKCSSRGLVGEDRRQFEKRASVDFTRELSQIKTAADEPLIHLLIIGATEAYGMNRNGDGFRQQACRDYHPTFVKYAKFFRDHKNKDAHKSYGRPVASAFNERMKRIELLVALNGSKEAADRHGGLVADKELEKLARGDDLPISMACRVAFDVCSFCGNRAPTRAEYCMGIDEGGMCKAGGLKHRIGSLVDVDGVLHALHADNPHPTFFDCSHVFRPADRIAYVLGQLEKTASSQGRRVTGAELAATMGVTIPYELLVEQNYPSDVRRMLKLAYVLADLEQEITHGECPAAAHAFTISSQGACPSPPPYYREKFAQFLRSLVDARICLSPEHFVQLIAGCSQEKAAAVAEIVRQALPGIYSRMLSSEEFVEKVAGNPYVPTPSSNDQMRLWAIKQASALSLRACDVTRRAQLAVLRGETPTVVRCDDELTKLAWAADDPVNRLAEQYALYKLAFLSAIPEQDPDLALTTNLVIVQNYTA